MSGYAEGLLSMEDRLEDEGVDDLRAIAELLDLVLEGKSIVDVC